MKLLIVGYGKMGRLVDQLARAAAIDVVGRLDIDTIGGAWPEADVAIDFSVAEALPANFARLAERRTNVVIGTTGWAAHEAGIKAQAAKAGIGVVASANFSIGVNVFQLVVEEAAKRMAEQPDYESWIHEAHHSAKRDAPSGTAILLRDAMVQAGYSRAIDMSSTRAGKIPGTHTVGFDSQSDTIELTHTARDRGGFARGALLAARWVNGRVGWFSMMDVLRG
jgi:4-hydroxy-tetrahydrodipicolinate reductase